MWGKTTPMLGWLLVSIEPDAIERACGRRLLCSEGQGEWILVRILFLAKKKYSSAACFTCFDITTYGSFHAT